MSRGNGGSVNEWGGVPVVCFDFCPDRQLAEPARLVEVSARRKNVKTRLAGAELARRHDAGRQAGGCGYEVPGRARYSFTRRVAPSAISVSSSTVSKNWAPC